MSKVKEVAFRIFLKEMKQNIHDSYICKTILFVACPEFRYRGRGETHPDVLSVFRIIEMSKKVNWGLKWPNHKFFGGYKSSENPCKYFHKKSVVISWHSISSSSKSADYYGHSVEIFALIFLMTHNRQITYVLATLVNRNNVRRIFN